MQTVLLRIWTRVADNLYATSTSAAVMRDWKLEKAATKELIATFLQSNCKLSNVYLYFL